MNLPKQRVTALYTARYPYVLRCDVTAAIGAQILSYGPLPLSMLRSRVSETTAWLTFSGLISGGRSFRYNRLGPQSLASALINLTLHPDCQKHDS